jgi:MFS family permease
MQHFRKDLQYYKFSLYGFFKNLRFFEPFLILFFLDKGMSYTQIGLLYAVREVGINILEIPTGIMADLVGRKRTMLMAFSSYIISFGVFYWISGFWPFILAMVCFAFGESFRGGTHKAMIFMYLKMNGWENQKVAYYGHTRSWSQMGSALSSLLAAAIVLISGNYQAVFLLSILPYIADFILIATYPEELDGEIQNNSGSISSRLREVWDSMRLAFQQLTLFRLFGNLALFGGLFKASKDYLQPILVMAVLAVTWAPGVSPENKSTIAIGIIYFIIYSITAATTRNSGKITARIGTLGRTINITLVLGAIISIAVGFLVKKQVPMVAAILFLFLFVIENLRKPVGISAVADNLTPNILATGLSTQSLLESLVSALFAFLLGILADHAGLGVAFITSGIMVLIIFPWLRVKTTK